MATTEWSVLFDRLAATLDGSPPGAYTPQQLAEFLREQIRPRCLALLVDSAGPTARQLVWGYGFDLPPLRVVQRGVDPLAWLSKTTGVALFSRRSQAYAAVFKIGRNRNAWLCVVSARRGQALVMERMYLTAAGVMFGRRLTTDVKAGRPGPPAFEGAPLTLRSSAAGSRGPAGATLTLPETDKKAFLNFAQAVESAAESIVICDRSGRIEYVNPAFERTSGYGLKEVIGENPRILKSGLHPPSVYAEMWKTILSGRPWLGTFVNRRKDGHLYDEEMTIAPIRVEDGTITGFVSVGEDVTERLQRERERKALTRASLAATGALDLTVALEIILNSAVQATAADGGGVVFVGRARAEFQHPVFVGTLTSEARRASGWLSAIEKLATEQPETVSIPSESQLHALGDLQSIAIMSLRTRGEVIGAAFVAAHRPGVFSSRLSAILESLARQATGAVETALLHQELRRRVKVLESLGHFTRALRSADSLDGLLRLVVDEDSSFLQATGAALCLVDSSGSALSVRVSVGQLAALKGAFRVADSVLGLPLRLGHVVIADERDIETLGQLAEAPDLRAVVLSPLGTSAGPIGTLVLSRSKASPFSAADIDLLTILNDVASAAIHRVRLREELEEAYVGATIALAEAVDAKDSYVAGHAQRTGDLAERVARQLSLAEDQVQDIRYGAILHDVGKFSVPDSILKKAGPLSSDEWSVIHRHTIAGARILAPVARLSRAAQVVRHHHERWDGSGYPGGLRGEEIPIGARIVAVVDAYTAMIDERTYRQALTHEEAVRELQRHAGTQFDPAVVEAFLRVVNEIGSQP